MASRRKSKKNPTDYITPEGYEALLNKLEYLKKVKLPSIFSGDSKKSSSMAKGEEMGRVEQEIFNTQNRLGSVEIKDPLRPGGDHVQFGSLVTVQRLTDPNSGAVVSYHILGPDEADPSKGSLSYRSPLGRALMGKVVDDIVDFQFGSNEVTLMILAIQPKAVPPYPLLPTQLSRPNPYISYFFFDNFNEPTEVFDKTLASEKAKQYGQTFILKLGPTANDLVVIDLNIQPSPPITEFDKQLFDYLE